MRPSIDIPHELNGAVKDFAKGGDMELSEAYMVLLKRGLETKNEGGKGR